MKIEGSREIPVARQKVWDAFLDPTVIEKAMPGCEKLEAIGPGEYKATMKVGVGPIKGRQQTYVAARCPDGRLQARGSVSFADGSSLTGSIFRPCRARG